MIKNHITQKQLDELSNKQRLIVQSYYRSQGLPKLEFGPEFWSIGRMIEFLNNAILMKSLKVAVNEGKWLDYYGFNLSATLQEQWCDKLWERIKSFTKDKAETNIIWTITDDILQDKK